MQPAPEHAPRPGQCQEVESGVRRVVAPNPSPKTYWGTNSYVLGHGRVAVIDPGPDLPSHGDAILAALRPGEEISHIFVTHSHLDHAPLARRLARVTGAEVLAFGPHDAGQSPLMRELAGRTGLGGGEGIDREFTPDRRLDHREEIRGETWRLRALWTPGHISNHLCFAWEDRIFTGDHVMGWASSLVSPPDGDLAAFRRSCEALGRGPAGIFYPGHGAPVTEPADRLNWLVTHRRMREAQIRAALQLAPGTAEEIARRVYEDLAPALLPAAARNVLAHLIDLSERGLAVPRGPLGAATVFHPGPGNGPDHEKSAAHTAR